MLISSRIDMITDFFATLRNRYFINPINVYSEYNIENEILWLPIIFALGIGIYFYLPFEPSIILVFFAFIFTLALYFATHKHKFLLLVLISLSGFTASKIRTENAHTPIIQEKIKYTQIIGRVLGLEKLEENAGSRIILGELKIEKINETNTPRKIRLRLRKDTHVQIGQKISVLASLMPPSPPLITKGFDFRRYLYFQGIGAVGFVYKEPKIIDGAKQRFINIQSIRQSIRTKLMTALMPETSGIATALIIGQKNMISEENKDVIRHAGLAHLLAISGLHIGLVAGTIFFLCRLLLSSIEAIALKYPIKKAAVFFAFSGALFYTLLAGATVPTMRALLMTTIVFLAIILDRNPISLRMVAISALIVLCIAPESLLSASFHMSFAAVTCLVFFYNITNIFWLHLSKNNNVARKLSIYFLGLCITTVIASLATAPFSIYHFGEVSVLGSAANLMAVPLFAFIIMPFSILSLVFMPSGLEYYPLQVVGFGIHLMLDIAHTANTLPIAAIRVSAWNFEGFLCFVIASILLLLLTKKAKLLSLPFLFTSILITNTQTKPDILISSSHHLLFFNLPDQIYSSNMRGDRFIRKNWERYFGLKEKSSISMNYQGSEKSDNEPYICADNVCRLKIKDKRVSYLKDNYYLQDECLWADILISHNPVNKEKCHALVIIDKFSTWKEGAHSIYITTNNTVNIETVSQYTSNRPWSHYRQIGD